MTVPARSKIPSLVAMVLVVGCISFPASSCGTEVGNGQSGSTLGGLLKNKKSEDRSGRTDGDSSKDQKSMPPDADSTSAPAQPAEVMVKRQLLFSLLNSCASPLLDQVSVGLQVLSGRRSPDKVPQEVEIENLSASGAGERLWQVRLYDGGSGNTYTAKALPGQTLEVSDADSVKVMFQGSCGAVTQVPQAKIPESTKQFVKKSVILTGAGGLSTSLDWYVLTDGGESFLQRVEIRSEGMEVILNRNYPF